MLTPHLTIIIKEGAHALCVTSLLWHGIKSSLFPVRQGSWSVRHDFVESALSPFLVQMSLS